MTGHEAVSVVCQLCCQSRRELARSAQLAHTPVVCELHTMGSDRMRTDAHNIGREERRALLEQRRAVVARQLRRLAIELTDLDRQLDQIVHSER